MFGSCVGVKVGIDGLLVDPKDGTFVGRKDGNKMARRWVVLTAGKSVHELDSY